MWLLSSKAETIFVLNNLAALQIFPLLPIKLYKQEIKNRLIKYVCWFDLSVK